MTFSLSREEDKFVKKEEIFEKKFLKPKPKPTHFWKTGSPHKYCVISIYNFEQCVSNYGARASGP